MSDPNTPGTHPEQPGPYGPSGAYSRPGPYGTSQPGPRQHPDGGLSPEPPLTPDGDRLVATFDHLLNIVAPAVGPLVLWLVTRRRGPLAESEGREALNFGITAVIAYFAIGVLSVLALFGGPLALLVPPLTPLLWVAIVVFSVLGAVQANQGRRYRYPATFRFVT